MIELPEEIASLYRHLDRHMADSDIAVDIVEVVGDAELSRQMMWFVGERVNIWAKKYRKEPTPYTDDLILGKYRFCNILRELDRQTIEYHTLLNPLRDNFPLWLLNMFYARMVARPDTVRAAGLLSFDASQNSEVYERLIDHPKPRYGSPYVFPVNMIMKSDTPTRELFLTRHLPAAMKRVAEEIATWSGESVLTGIEKVMPLFGYNMAFLWTEVLIDVAYQYPDKVDLFAPFPIGPGAAPTFARMGETISATQRVYELGKLKVSSGIYHHGKPIALSAENWEGIGCEFRKYTNLSAGKGRRRYYAKSLD